MPFFSVLPMRPALLRLLPLVLAVLLASEATAQKREFRGAWIATVANIDWPVRGAGATAQKQGLITILDRLRATGVNAVFFQVRSESDAMYRSDIEPWSYWLTGTQGQDPGFDPLAFAVAEAHKRGMELHAWMNPYQVERSLSGAYTTAANHLSRTHPEWTMIVGNKRVLNPGLPAVSEHVGRVVADVVRRYDVDGVHFDDYFYFEGMTTVQDSATFNAYRRGGGTMTLANWRRDNVNRMVALVNDSVRTTRASAKFGISPTGIRLNSDAGTRGYESYNAVYADGLAWLRAKTIDYIVPQVYWYIGKPAANYAAVVPWWASVATERHLYIGEPGYKIGSTEDGSYTYNAATIGANIRFSRPYIYVRGNVIFNTTSVVSGGVGYGRLADTLRAYWTPHAVPVVMPWKGDTDAPNAPTALAPTSSGPTITVSWTKPLPAADGDTARWYGVYRFPQGTAVDLSTNRYLVNVIGGGRTAYADTPPASEGTVFTYVVTAFDKAWNESAGSLPVVGTDVTADAPAPPPRFDAPLPNPARAGEAVRLRFALAQAGPVTMTAYDVLGREVAVLLNTPRAAGAHEVAWTTPATPGLYLLRLRTEGGTVTQTVIVR